MRKVATSAGSVSVLFDGPENAAVFAILGHGAGGDMRSDFMATMAEGLAASGIGVCRFNFAYSESGRKAPDRQPVLEATFADVVREVASSHEGKLVLGGKSLGGRIASHVAAETACDGLVFLGYPLHAPGRPDRIRSSHLADLSVPMLFVEGTRDPFCPLATLEKVRADLTAPTDLAVIEGGDHSFKVRKSSGRTTAEAWQEAIGAVSNWLKKL